MYRQEQFSVTLKCMDKGWGKGCLGLGLVFFLRMDSAFHMSAGAIQYRYRFEMAVIVTDCTHTLHL